jgi:hypothetical protein
MQIATKNTLRDACPTALLQTRRKRKREWRERETTEVKHGEKANIDDIPVTLLYHIPDVTGSIGNSVGITHKYR